MAISPLTLAAGRTFAAVAWPTAFHGPIAGYCARPRRFG